MKKSRVFATVSLLLIVGAFLTPSIPKRIFASDGEAAEAFANRVADLVEDGVEPSAFRTGSRRFDFEWRFGSYQMAVAGISQVILEHPETAERLRPRLRKIVTRLMHPSTRAFGTEAWGYDGVRYPERAGHAYLGYLNLSLGLACLADPEFTEHDAHDALSSDFERELQRAPVGLVETYPGESYPVDVAAIVGSLALHDRCRAATAHQDTIRDWTLRHFRRYVDADSGLLVQSAEARTGRAVDAPRASGTALAIYFLSYADHDVARELWAGIEDKTFERFGPFGGVREYATGRAGSGDIDSGPVIFGIGVSPTGFSLAGARMFAREGTFAALSRTALVFGVPYWSKETWGYATGGPLGNAILLAMMTAPVAKTERSRVTSAVGAPVARSSIFAAHRNGGENEPFLAQIPLQ